MNTEKSAPEQAKCLPNANIDHELPVDYWSVDDSAIKIRAWRIGNKRVAYVCPSCGGFHSHGCPDRVNALTTRTLSCPDVFAHPGVTQIDLLVTDDPAPDFMRAIFDDDIPLGDLVEAYKLIEAGSRGSPHRARILGSDSEEIWVPSRADVRFALDALRRCGGLDEARALREEYEGLSGRRAWRAAAADVWRRGQGHSFKQRLLDRLKSCYRSGGC
jgi:hypothetical protein